MKMPFGKYKEEDITDVPIGYIKWLEQQNIPADLRDILNGEIKRREGQETSRGRDVVLISKAEEMRVKAYTNFLTGKIRRYDFIGKTNPEIESTINIWRDQYLDKFERVK